MFLYKASTALIQCFTSLFLSEFSLPYLHDVNSTMVDYLEKSKMPATVAWFLRRLSWKFQCAKLNLIALSELGFNSKHFSCADIMETVSDERSPLLFFDLIMREATYVEEECDDILNYYLELSTHIILYNKISDDRIRAVLKLFDDVGKIMKDYHETRNFDEKKCSCTEFAASGNCGCVTDDVNA